MAGGSIPHIHNKKRNYQGNTKKELIELIQEDLDKMLILSYKKVLFHNWLMMILVTRFLEYETQIRPRINPFNSIRRAHRFRPGTL